MTLQQFFPPSAFPAVAGLQDLFASGDTERADDHGLPAAQGAEHPATPDRRRPAQQLALAAAENALWLAEAAGAAAHLAGTPPAKKQKLVPPALPAKKSQTKDKKAIALLHAFQFASTCFTCLSVQKSCWLLVDSCHTFGRPSPGASSGLQGQRARPPSPALGAARPAAGAERRQRRARPQLQY